MNNDIGSRIRRYRVERELTQQNLANDINYSDKVISKWERGESIPDISAIKILSDYFNVAIDDLLEEKSDKDENKQSAKLHSLSNYKLPLIILQSIFAMLVVLFVVEIFAIISNYSDPILTFAKVIAVLFFVIVALDIIFVYLNIPRSSLIISFLVLATIAVIGGIISYIIYDTDIIVLNPNVAVKLALTSLAVICVDYLVEIALGKTVNANKKGVIVNNTSSIKTTDYAPNTSISIIIQIISLSFLLLTCCAFLFKAFEIKLYLYSYSDTSFAGFDNSYFIDIMNGTFVNIKINLYQFFFTSTSVLNIMTAIVLVLIFSWDVFLFIYCLICKVKNTRNKLNESIITPIILIVFSILLLLLYSISIIVFFIQLYELVQNYTDITPLFGIFFASICIVGLALSRIINAIYIIIKTKNAKICKMSSNEE